MNVYQEVVEHASSPMLADALGFAFPKLEPKIVSDACPVVGAFLVWASLTTGPSNEKISAVDPTTVEMVSWIDRKPIVAGVGMV